MKLSILPLCIGLIFGMLYTFEGILYRDYNQDEFQVAAAYLKDRDASLFAEDFIWGKPEMIRNLHVCVRTLMHVTDILTLGQIKEPIDLFLIWLPICVLLFFLGIYLLCMHFTEDRWASILVACSFMLVRRTIWDWWGLGPTFTMSARGLVLSMLPLALWAFFKCQNHRAPLALCFFIWGLISNLHPLSGWGFVELLSITVLFVGAFRLRAWSQVAIMGGATLLGSLPFLFIWSQVITVPESLQANPMLVRNFWDGFMGLEAPPSKFIFQFLQDLSLPLILCISGYWVWFKTGRRGDWQSTDVLYCFPFVVIIMTVLVMVTGYVLRKAGISLPVMVPEHSRNIKLLYLTLPVWMAFAFTGWFRFYSPSLWPWKRGVPILMVITLLAINFPGHKLARYLSHKIGWDLVPETKKYLTSVREDAEDLEVALWARKNTSPDALFYFDSYEFRYYARRSLVFCWFDRPCVGFRPTKELEEWVSRRNKIVPLKKQGLTTEMFKTAKAYHANYLVTLNDWKPVQGIFPIWANKKYSVYQVPP